MKELWHQIIKNAPASNLKQGKCHQMSITQVSDNGSQTLIARSSRLVQETATIREKILKKKNKF